MATFSYAAEFDVADCFLNTSRDAAIPALKFWFAHLRRRGPLHFSISKDSVKADHLGSSSSPHFWCVSSVELPTVVEWKLLHNDLFECVSGIADRPLVLRQIAGLPTGGYLSAALSSLWRCSVSWCRAGQPSSRDCRLPGTATISLSRAPLRSCLLFSAAGRRRCRHCWICRLKWRLLFGKGGCWRWFFLPGLL